MQTGDFIASSERLEEQRRLMERVLGRARDGVISDILSDPVLNQRYQSSLDPRRVIWASTAMDYNELRTYNPFRNIPSGLGAMEIAQDEDPYRATSPFRGHPLQNDDSLITSDASTTAFDESSVREALRRLQEANVPFPTLGRGNNIRRKPVSHETITDEVLIKAEQALISKELAQEFSRAAGMAIAETMDARLMGCIIDRAECKLCKDGWIKLEKGEYELCECAEPESVPA